jgi:hypothetical protein
MLLLLVGIKLLMLAKRKTGRVVHLLATVLLLVGIKLLRIQRLLVDGMKHLHEIIQ